MAIRKSNEPFVDLLQICNIRQIQEITNVVLSASLAFELGRSDWRILFTQAKNKRPAGRLREIYTFLESLDDGDIEHLCAVMTESPEIPA